MTRITDSQQQQQQYLQHLPRFDWQCRRHRRRQYPFATTAAKPVVLNAEFAVFAAI